MRAPDRAGRWFGDGPPTRDQALMLAVECADAAAGIMVTAARSKAMADASLAWTALAAALPPAQPVAPVKVSIGQCGHGRTAMRIEPGGSWMHVSSLSSCGQPPAQVDTVDPDLRP